MIVTGALEVLTSSSRQSGAETGWGRACGPEVGVALATGIGVFLAATVRACCPWSGAARQRTNRPAMMSASGRVVLRKREIFPWELMVRIMRIIRAITSFQHAPRDCFLRRHECGKAHSHGPRWGCGNGSRAPAAPRPGHLYALNRWQLPAQLLWSFRAAHRSATNKSAR